MDPIPHVPVEKNNVMDLEVKGEVDVEVLNNDEQDKLEGQTEIDFK